MVIAHDGREGLDGWFQKSFPVSGGEFHHVSAMRKTGNVTLQWLGPSQQFQVLRATAATGPFTPIGAPQPGTSYTDPGILKTNARAFYRIRY